MHLLKLHNLTLINQQLLDVCAMTPDYFHQNQTICSDFLWEILNLFCSHSFPQPPLHLCKADKHYRIWLAEREMQNDFPEPYKKSLSELENQLRALLFSPVLQVRRVPIKHFIYTQEDESTSQVLCCFHTGFFGFKYSIENA